MSIFARSSAFLIAVLVSAAFAVGSTDVARADVPHLILHVSDHPLPNALDLHGAAVAPESQLLPCSKDDRAMLQPDLNAVSALVARAGGARLRKRDFQAGAPITTPDGLIFTLVPTPNGSYVVSIDSGQTRAFPERYFDPCLKMASGNIAKITRLGLVPPRANLGTAQYSPAVGFYLFMNY